MKWTIEELQLLKELRESYGKNSWEKIAKEINSSLICKCIKTGRQCRDKYVNSFKSNEKGQTDNIWTPEENQKIYDLYMIHGSSWTIFESSFPNKAPNAIKNKFYNSLRKMSRELISYQKTNFKDCRNVITHENLLAILELSTRLRQWIHKNDYRESSKSKILTNSRQILKRTFLQDSRMEESFMQEIIKNFKYFNYRLKSLGVYKSGFRKEWQLTKSRLIIIFKTDIIIENQEQLQSLYEEKTQSSIKQTENTESEFLCFKQDDLQSLDLQQQNKFLHFEKDAGNPFQKSSLFLFEDPQFGHLEEIYDSF